MKSLTDRFRQGGFSLLEVLVAFSIMALALGVLLRIFGGGVRMSGLASEHAEAALAAESLLTGVGIESPLNPGETSGEWDERFRWTLRVTPYVSGSEPVPEAPQLKLLWVEMIVDWGDETERREFSLQTLKLVSANQQMGGFQ